MSIEALRLVLSGCDPDVLAEALPVDCVSADVLDLVSAHDEKDFIRALSTGARLGKLGS